MNEHIDITWLGHACFMLEADSYKLLLDPYKDGYVPGLRLNKQLAHEVICSHEHTDHNFRDAVTILPSMRSPFHITQMETYHDDVHGAKRGKNTVTLIEAHGIRVAHLGDLGCELTQEQYAMLKGLDAVMIPVGGFYTVNAEQANAIIQKLSPHIVFPMHYKTAEYGFDVLSDIKDFTSLREDAVFCESNKLRLTKKLPLGCIVLKYIPEADATERI